MSKVAIAGNASGTGTLTVAAPNTNSDYTLTLPAETGTVLTSGGAIDVNASAPADSVAIDSSGNVGIGDTTPGVKLEIVGTTTSGLRLKSSAGASNGFNIYNNSSTDTAYLTNYYNGPMVFSTNNTERGQFDGSGNFKFNSGYGSVATAYGCRAWVNFNGTGTVAIRASGNISSLTDLGTGYYTIGFTNAMPDTNYSIGGSGGDLATTTSNVTIIHPHTLDTTYFTFVSHDDGATNSDRDCISVQIFR